MMGMWAARDQDGELAFFDVKPVRARPNTSDPEGVWQEKGRAFWEWSEAYGPDPLPALNWEDEPIKVKIEIIKV